MIAAYGVVWPILAELSRPTYGLSPSVRKRRFALPNGPICRVCARGKPSAQQTDPIIGLSQKRIKLTSLSHCLAGHVDLAGKASEWRSAHSEARMHDVRRSSAIPTDAALNAAAVCGGRAKTFEPAEVRYIKLGENGKWAASAVEDGVIPFGYPAVDHQACLTGDWDRVRDQLVKMGRTAGGVSQGLRELKEFYGLPDDTLWVTMTHGHFWWAFATGPVLEVDRGNLDGPARCRRTRTG